MTYVNTLQERHIFNALRDWLIARRLTLRSLFWITGLLAFFMSPILDNLTTALDLWETSPWVAATFGADVQQHYANMARIELQAFGEAVTDWERYRGFERL